MIGMIEQTHGAGLSGIAGIAAKGAKGALNAKNSLFGKLLVILEQHGKQTGKGSALLMGKTGKQATLSHKGEALIASKSEHLLALAAKGKQHIKSQTDDPASMLIAAHAFINAAIQSNKPDHSGKAGVALQATPVKGEQTAMAGKVLIKASLFDASGSNGQSDKASDKAAQALLTDAKLSGAKSAHAVDQTQKIVPGLAQVQSPASATDNQLQATEKAQLMAGKENAAIRQQLAAGESAQKMAAAESAQRGKNMDGRQLTDEQIANAAGQTNPAAVEKTAMRAKSKSANALAAAQSQQQSTAANSTATMAGIAIPDASLKDTGSQTTGNGNQDGRFITAPGGDTKAANAQTASSASFHQYLSSKATPSMTLFDSMNHIAQSASKGKTRLEIQLDPANLGKIQISLQSDAAKHLQVHIIADQSGTRQLIDQQLPQLKSALAQQGFDLSGFSMDSRGQNASSGGDHSQGKRTVSHTAETTMDTVNLIASPNRTASGSGLSIRI